MIEFGAGVLCSKDGSSAATKCDSAVCSFRATNVQATTAGITCSAERAMKVLERVQRPEIATAGEGPYVERVCVQILCGTPEAEVWYTTDGSDPTGAARRLCSREGFVLSCGAGCPETIHVRAVAAWPGTMTDSEEAARRFDVVPAMAETPGGALDPTAPVLLRIRRADGMEVAEPGEAMLGTGKGEVVIGRSMEAGLRIHESFMSISRQQCVVRRGGSVELVNLSRKAVILVGIDGAMTVAHGPAPRPLRRGDTIILVGSGQHRGCCIDVVQVAVRSHPPHGK